MSGRRHRPGIATVNALRDAVRSEVAEAAAPRIHAWHIEEREYARHEQRRGRRHAFERILPERTALVVLDMVPFFVEENEYCLGIVPNIQSLASCLRAAGGVVAWVLPRHGEPTAREVEFLGPDVAHRYGASGGFGPPRARLWPEFEVADSDIVVEKTAASAFFPDRSPLPGILQAP